MIFIPHFCYILLRGNHPNSRFYKGSFWSILTLVRLLPSVLEPVTNLVTFYFRMETIAATPKISACQLFVPQGPDYQIAR